MMLNENIWDGQSALVVGNVVSYASEGAIVRWLDSNQCVIENINNGYCLKIDQADLLPISETSTEKNLQQLIASYTGDADGLVKYLIDNGVTIS
ncbi:hypothetical protein SP5M_0078 [Escherichia phage vB_EcoP_SP5M]|uniref:Uncharacterized protein n=1 Tax=Escherichia phage vB_EcoP_SP5M TaxID=2750853 RepID=A0A7D5FMQ3_9CAUD|nr:hypothetical protein PP763_gp70 [Escherichia phage vB_EcoP_SP5M]QLF80729.1 hypothetical protein SP5M_0078 [Escherichia phage vB_EcoP_SP5M]